MQINITKKVTEYRLRHGFSQSKVAESVGLSLDEYIQLENGSFNPNYFTLLVFSKFYHVPISSIYDQNKILVKNIIENFINQSTSTIETDEYIECKY